MKEADRLLLGQLDDIITENLHDSDFQLNDITEQLEISRTTLYRLIVKLTGMSPNSYIRKKRLEKAKEILEIGVYPTVKETALAVGFKNPSYFSRLFYEAFGITPFDLLRG